MSREMREIEVHTGKAPDDPSRTMVEAEVHGAYAIYETHERNFRSRGLKWRVTHVASGVGMGAAFHYKASARKAAKFLDRDGRMPPERDAVGLFEWANDNRETHKSIGGALKEIEPERFADTTRTEET